MTSFIVVTDTPGIKQFVFGSDVLREIQGASALLDRLNREESEPELCGALAKQGAKLTRTLYANGGTGQFLVEAANATTIHQSLAELTAHYRQQTGGEARLVYGVGNLEQMSYRQAVHASFEELHQRRDWGAGHYTVTAAPLMDECKSLSYLPAVERDTDTSGGELYPFSRATLLKRDERNKVRRKGVWGEWMEHLGFPESIGYKLRCQETTDIGTYARPEGLIGLVYADGNAMGRLVQELDSAEVCAAFSKVVDDSIRQACFQALAIVCAVEVTAVQHAIENQKSLPQLPADILLLGGDDLLVLLPADRALRFARLASEIFQELTRTKIAQYSLEVKSFFKSRNLSERGLTISCGVALGRAAYPFYLLLELAESLLKSAKAGGSDDRDKQKYWAPAYLDFHQVTGSSSHDLTTLRGTDYDAKGDFRRTLRPYRVDRLGKLADGVQQLRAVQFPPTKLHALYEKGLEKNPKTAEREVQFLFSRCKPTQRQALWQALETVAPLSNFPWCDGQAPTATALIDLVEAYDLLKQEKT